MDQSLVVCGGKSARQLDPDVDRLTARKRTAPESGAEALTFEQFRDHKPTPVVVTGVEYREDVGV